MDDLVAHQKRQTLTRLMGPEWAESQVKRKADQLTGVDSDQLRDLFLVLPLDLQRQVSLLLSYEQIEAICQGAGSKSKQLRENLCENEQFWQLWVQKNWPYYQKRDTFKETARYFVQELPEKSAYQRALQNDPRITYLNLGYNQIGDAGAQALAQNQTITTLDLHGNQIGDAGAQALAQNQTITELYLYGNQIGDAGAHALAQNQTITYLNLGSNQIGDAGAQALAQNQTITTLDLTRNPISQKLQQQLRSDPRITFRFS